MMGDDTQTKIRDYLRKNQSASTAELAQALIVTKADIQYHLKLLEEEGVVQRLPGSAVRQRGRGRPVILFRLAPLSKPDNLAGLASALLDTLIPAAATGEVRSDTLDRLAVTLFGLPEPTHSLTAALSRVVAQLNRYPYQARWEARRVGPCILLKNCPYAHILPEHPELCELDLHALRMLLQRPVQMDARIDFQRPSSACLFRVSAAPSPRNG